MNIWIENWFNKFEILHTEKNNVLRPFPMKTLIGSWAWLGVPTCEKVVSLYSWDKYNIHAGDLVEVNKLVNRKNYVDVKTDYAICLWVRISCVLPKMEN